MPKRKQFFILSIGFLFLGLFACPGKVHAGGNIYYVATNGDDSDGSTWIKAKKTIQAAINTASDGDIIIVASSGTEHGDGTYTENVNVTKSLIIKSENGYATTTVVAADANDYVFEVTASSVTIGGEDCGFSIYGATGEGQAGILLNEVNGCTIQDNRCGWDDSHRNKYGIFLVTSSDNIISGNTVSSNTQGISMALSESNTISYNTCTSNEGSGIYLASSNNNKLMSNITNSNITGIFLEVSSNNNTLISNTANSNLNHGIYLNGSSNNALIDNTTNSNGTDGIWVYTSSNCNMLTNNTANFNTHYGIYLDHSDINTLTGSTANSNNDYGIYLSFSNNNVIYLNNFSNTNNVYSQASTNTWHSPTPLFYHYTGDAYHKNSLGNYYSDYDTTGQDSDRDGIGNTDYTNTDKTMTDSSPLVATSDHYSLQAWWLSGDSQMYRADMTKAPDSVIINGGSSQIWIADQATIADVSFSSTGSWTGQIVFTSAPASGETFTVEIGFWDGSDFTAGGPDATIIGDGSATVFTYMTDASGFMVPTGNYLALKITNNNSGSDYAVQTGGAWSYCSAPDESQDYSLPVELTSFTATPGNGIITLKWITESEIENLGFNIYRSTAENGEFVMLNDKLIAGAGSSSEKHEYRYVDHDVKSGITYWYKLEDVDYKGKTELHGAISAAVLGPKEFCLHPNYPNPFNPVTTISYDLPKDVYVELTVYNMLGEKVTTLVKGNQPAGYYSVEWDGRNSQGRIVSSGMYFLRISAGSYCKTNKMVFVR